jgi:ubiquitin related modifier 1
MLCVYIRRHICSFKMRSGGLEYLFDNQKRVEVEVPTAVATMGDLIQWVRKTLVRERHGMFMQGTHIRPGVLVLINDTDWELEDTVNYRIVSGDSIAFISTLHGG